MTDKDIVPSKKLEGFERMSFWIWQQEMLQILSALKLDYVLWEHKPKGLFNKEDTTDACQANTWSIDNALCRAIILRGMASYLIDIYNDVNSAKELWDLLEIEYYGMIHEMMFYKYKIEETRSMKSQFFEIKEILGCMTKFNKGLDESILVGIIIHKFPSSWNDFKRHMMWLETRGLSLEKLEHHALFWEQLNVLDKVQLEHIFPKEE